MSYNNNFSLPAVSSAESWHITLTIELAVIKLFVNVNSTHSLAVTSEFVAFDVINVCFEFEVTPVVIFVP